MPEVTSAPSKSNATARLYQPLTSGPRRGVPVVTCGAVSSYFSPKPNGPLVLPALSVQFPATEAVALSAPS